MDFGYITGTIEQELGAKVSKLFSRFDEKPLATASLGQVHTAGEAVDSFDRKTYESEIAGIIAQHVDQSVGDMPAGAVLFRMIDTGYKMGLKLPAELTLPAKALMIRSWPRLAIIGFTIAAVLALYMVVTILISDGIRAYWSRNGLFLGQRSSQNCAANARACASCSRVSVSAARSIGAEELSPADCEASRNRYDFP